MEKMEEKNQVKKNHWTGTKVNDANKKINQEIYQRKRQAYVAQFSDRIVQHFYMKEIEKVLQDEKDYKERTAV